MPIAFPDKVVTYLSNLNESNCNTALVLMLYLHFQHNNKQVTSGTLCTILNESGIGNPNSTILRQQLEKTKLIINKNGKLSLKQSAIISLRSKHPKLFSTKPDIDHEHGFLPQDVWRNSHPHIEHLCKQINGCHKYHFWDAASVLCRRLIETLIIDAYENKSIESELKRNGNYLMLNGIISKVENSNSLHLGRDAVKTLRMIKEIGDRSAHNRRYQAVKADLTRIHSGLRVTLDELLLLAGYR